MQRLVLAVLVALLLPACAKNFDYYLTDAKLGENTQSILEGHHVEPGHDTVLLVRNWSKGEFFTVDDEGYEKLSIQLPEVRRGERYDINQPGVRYSYSVGASAWPDRGGAYAESAQGHIDIIEVTEHDVTARLDFTFKIHDLFRDKPLPTPIHLTGLHTFARIGHDQLTPWIGAAGDHVYYETYPSCGCNRQTRTHIRAPDQPSSLSTPAVRT